MTDEFDIEELQKQGFPSEVIRMLEEHGGLGGLDMTVLDSRRVKISVTTNDGHQTRWTQPHTTYDQETRRLLRQMRDRTSNR